MTVVGDTIEVPLGRGRRQTVAVEDGGAHVRLWSVVVRAGRVDDSVHERAWTRNRLSEFVGFRLDRRGRLVGETRVPDDASAEEWALLVHNLASACDHFEYLLTGRDIE
jgi:hypothetical protein